MSSWCNQKRKNSFLLEDRNIKPKLDNITNRELPQTYYNLFFEKFSIMNLGTKRKSCAEDKHNKNKYPKLKSENSLSHVRSENWDQMNSDLIKNKTERKNKQGNERKLSKIKTNSHSDENENNVYDQPENGAEFFYSVLTNVLGKHYLNVYDRFDLDFRPQCLKNFNYCLSHHSGLNAPLVKCTPIYHEIDARHLLVEDRFRQFTKFVLDFYLKNEFPGEVLMQILLELILTLNLPSTEQKQRSYIISECSSIFMKVIINYPPCWRDAKKYYVNILRKSFYTELIDLSMYEPNNGIFYVAFAMLSDLLTKSEVTFTDEQVENLYDEELKIISDYNFYQWDSVMTQRLMIDRVKRNEKISRIFLVLDAILKLIEMDLAIFALKYKTNLNKHLRVLNRMPLIVSVLWSDTPTGEITLLIKMIISSFVHCVMLNYPEQKIRILSKIMNVIGHTIEMAELETNESQVEYPRIRYNLTENFAKEIFKTIEQSKDKNPSKSSNRNMDLYITMVDTIRTPVIKLLLADLILNKIDHDYKDEQPNMAKIFNKFLKNQWTDCEPGGMYVLNKDKKFPFSFEYSWLPNNSKRKKNEVIYDSDYMYLLYIALKSYLSVSRLQEIVKSLIERKIHKSKTNSFDKNEYIAPTEEELLKIEENIDYYVSKIPFQQKANTPTSTTIICEDIIINEHVALRYHNEIKILFELGDFILNEKAQNGTLFDKFHKLINIDTLFRK